jgi:hypothetical protein
VARLLDLHLEPSSCRLNIWRHLWSTRVDVDLSLMSGENTTYRLFTGEFNMTLTPQ